MIPLVVIGSLIKPPSHSNTAWSHRGLLFAHQASTRVPKDLLQPIRQGRAAEGRRPIPKATRSKVGMCRPREGGASGTHAGETPAGTRLAAPRARHPDWRSQAFRAWFAAGPGSIGRQRAAPSRNGGAGCPLARRESRSRGHHRLSCASTEAVPVIHQRLALYEAELIQVGADAAQGLNVL